MHAYLLLPNTDGQYGIRYWHHNSHQRWPKAFNLPYSEIYTLIVNIKESELKQLLMYVNMVFFIHLLFYLVELC